MGGRGWLFPALSGPVRAASKTVLAKFVAAEAVKRDLAKSRNDLESYIIAMKEALETDELMQKVRVDGEGRGRGQGAGRGGAGQAWSLLQSR